MSKAQEGLIKATKFKGYKEGGKVWLEGTNIKRPYDSPKLSPRRYGPFEVVAKISPVVYKLRLPETWQIHDMFHASLLTPFTETEEHGCNFIELPPDKIEGEEEWEVEQILGKRHHSRGRKLQYLVRWKGYAPTHNQWIDRSDMNASELIDAYETRQTEHPPRRSIRTPRKGPVATIRSATLSHSNELLLENHYRPMSQEQDAAQITTTSLLSPRPATPVDLLPATTIVFQTQHGGHLALIPVGGTVAPTTTQVSIALTSGAPPTPSPEPLPMPSQQGPPNPPLRPGADHLNSHPLSWRAASHRDEPERLQKLWEDSRRLDKYHTTHGEFPTDFRRARYSKAAFVAGKLAALPAPPTTILEVISSYEVARKYDNLLEQYVHLACAALDEVAPAPLPQGDTVLNSPIPMERVENVSTNNEDEGQTPAAAPEDKGKGRDTQVAAREEAEGVDMELGDSEKEKDPDHPGAG
jgi:Chromo (CHRromatin Organisation MOdifier) domain